MESKIKIGGRTITLRTAGLDSVIDIDDITSIDYSNLYGEAVTVSALMNRWGIIRAEAEKIHQEKIIDRRRFRAEVRSGFRKEAAKDKTKMFTDPLGCKIKISVDAVDDAVLLDRKYQEKQESEIEAKKDLDLISSIYWAVQSKDKKLNNIVKATTPNEFVDELIEGSVNGMIISKAK